MIRCINGHGFAAIRQIARWMGSSYQAAQRRTQILTEADFLAHRRPFRGGRVYLSTKIAIARAGDELPPLSRITLGSYVHTRTTPSACTRPDRCGHCRSCR